MDSDKNIFIELFPEDRRKERKQYVKGINHNENCKLAWSHHKENKKNIPSREEVISAIKTEIQNNISGRGLRNAALMSCIYLTGCRVHEILAYKKDNVNYSGLRLKDIKVITSTNHKQFVAIRTRVEKVEPLDWKSAFIHLDKGNPYCELLYIINNYVRERFATADLTRDIDELQPSDYEKFGELEVFRDISLNTARRICKKVFGRYMNLHIIRVWRCHHLVKYHGLTSFQLKKFIGWRSLQMAATYAEASDESLMGDLEESNEDI